MRITNQVTLFTYNTYLNIVKTENVWVQIYYFKQREKTFKTRVPASTQVHEYYTLLVTEEKLGRTEMLHVNIFEQTHWHS